jgi:dTMP kinase
MQPKLIVIEGLDGSGKSTQWEMLKQSFKDACFVTFPDYESHSGKIIKQYLAGAFLGETAYAASSFYAIDRYINLHKGKIAADLTISARYTSSNVIYQMSKLPESEWEGYLEWLYDYEFNKLGIPKADLTVFLDVPIEISQKLLEKRYADDCGSKDIHEGDIQYLHGCRRAALYVAERDRWRILDCVEQSSLRSPESINKQLTEIIREAAQ